ncbi:MAG: transposase [Akkermansia sp.]
MPQIYCSCPFSEFRCASSELKRLLRTTRAVGAALNCKTKCDKAKESGLFQIRWCRERAGKRGKRSLFWRCDSANFLPVDVYVSDAKMSDNNGAYQLMPAARSIIVADRGYDNSQLWRDWDSRGVTFVVRLRRDRVSFLRIHLMSYIDLWE